MILGEAGVGKSTTANYIAERGFIEISLADELKRIVKNVFHFSDEALWGPSELRNASDISYRRPDGSYLSPREALQKIGTEGFRSAYPNIWIDIVRKNIADLMNNPYLHYSKERGIYKGKKRKTPVGFIVPDARFQNEIEEFKLFEGKCIQIFRPSSLTGNALSLHASEVLQRTIPEHLIDHKIHNTGTIPDLYTCIDKILNQYKF
jgi:hypothetical protein